MPKVFIAGLIQLCAFIILIGVVWLLPLFIQPPFNPLYLALLMGTVALALSWVFKLPSWWFLLQFIFPTSMYWALNANITPLVSLGIFVAIWLFFSNSFKNRVPLYLTNSVTREALLPTIEGREEAKFLDLGSGLGGNVVFMSQQNQVAQSVGVETAPMPYLVSKLYTFFAGGEIWAKDLWKMELNEFDVVYAFLSPEPMEALWQKVLAEMPINSLFISNSFAVPDIEASEIWALPDQRETHLYLYNLRDFK